MVVILWCPNFWFSWWAFGNRVCSLEYCTMGSLVISFFFLGWRRESTRQQCSLWICTLFHKKQCNFSQLLLNLSDCIESWISNFASLSVSIIVLVYKNIMISDYTLWEIMTHRRMIIQSIVIIFVRVRGKIFRNLVGTIQKLVYLDPLTENMI